MNRLVISMFIAVMLAKYSVDGLRVAPSAVKYMPELFSAVALLVVVVRLLGGARFRLDWRYLVFLGLLLFVVLFGFFAQSVDAGPIIGGLRLYLKALPFLLLPAVYPFTERQIKTQVVWLFLLLCLEAPVAFYQKYFQFRDKWHTGDNITGTVTSSAPLSLLMLCGIAMLVALYLRNRLRLIPFFLGVGFMLAPTTINETKITIILLPLVMLLPAFFMPSGQRSLRKLMPILVTGCVAAIAFVSLYAYFFASQKTGETLGTFFTDQKQLQMYLYNKADKGRARDLGRLDTLVFAFRRLEQDPIVFLFGVGAGNASGSSSKAFEGKYAKYYLAYGVGYTQVTYFLWEIGFVGLFTYLFFFFIAYRDAVFLARTDSTFAVLGQAWSTIVVILGICLLYQSIFDMDELQYPFWFYCGLCASKVSELRFPHVTAASVRRSLSPARGSPAAVTGTHS